MQLFVFKTGRDCVSAERKVRRGLLSNSSSDGQQLM